MDHDLGCGHGHLQHIHQRYLVLMIVMMKMMMMMMIKMMIKMMINMMMMMMMMMTMIFYAMLCFFVGTHIIFAWYLANNENNMLWEFSLW
jgi:hypothetical protein